MLLLRVLRVLRAQFFRGVQFQHGMPGGAGAGEGIEHEIAGVGGYLQNALDKLRWLWRNKEVLRSARSHHLAELLFREAGAFRSRPPVPMCVYPPYLIFLP